jgi:prolyl-tRNA editing enzyme YbaK/EbsC (Cys-tRNA(Pro) deacylase)
MASAEETEKVTGFRPGGVCPFGVDGVPVYVDRALAEYHTIYPAAGTDASGVPMTFEQLVEITGGEAAELSDPPEA